MVQLGKWKHLYVDDKIPWKFEEHYIETFQQPQAKGGCINLAIITTRCKLVYLIKKFLSVNYSTTGW